MDSFSMGVYFSGYNKRKGRACSRPYPSLEQAYCDMVDELGPFLHLKNRQYTLLRANWEKEICQVLEIPTWKAQEQKCKVIRSTVGCSLCINNLGSSLKRRLMEPSGVPVCTHALNCHVQMECEMRFERRWHEVQLFPQSNVRKFVTQEDSSRIWYATRVSSIHSPGSALCAFKSLMLQNWVTVYPKRAQKGAEQLYPKIMCQKINPDL